MSLNVFILGLYPRRWGRIGKLANGITPLHEAPEPNAKAKHGHQTWASDTGIRHEHQTRTSAASIHAIA